MISLLRMFFFQSLNSKQRQLRKSGNELAVPDATELARVSGEQAILQKHLESARKQSRQHAMLIQVMSYLIAPKTYYIYFI